MNVPSRLLIGLTFAAGASALTGTAFAQDAAAQAPAASEAAPAVEEEGLQTVMVTAQKRSENVQDVPISISTVTAAAVQKAHTVNLEALTGAIPNVQIGHFSNNPQSAVFNIRGMGVIEPDPYAGQTVTVVVDGVPQAFNMISLPNLFDIDRVEILRGPQGTLFGANTTGGVVSIITKQPTGELGGDAEVSLGNWGRVDGSAALDFPLIEDKLAGKVTFIHHKQRGWHTNIVDGSSMGDQDTDALRGVLKWTPNENFSATLIQQADRASGGSPIVVQGGVPGDAEYTLEGTILPGQLQGQYRSPCLPAGQPCRAPKKYLSANSSVPDYARSDSDATTLTMNWDTGIGEIVSISGYKRFIENNNTDQDGTVLFLDDTQRRTKGYQITQEIRDTIRPTDSIQVIFGAYYMNNWYHHTQNFRIEFAAPGFRQLTTQDQHNRSASIFAQSYFDLSPKLRLQAGVRATEETTDMDARIDNFLNFNGPAIFTGDTPIPGGFRIRDDKTWRNVGGKLGLDYRVTDDSLVYGYIARGFKSGGFVGRLAIPQDVGPYDPEYVDTAEIGLKSDFLDHRLRANLSAFFNKYKDLQIAQIYFTEDVNGNTVNGNTIVNAANAETYGFELELSALVGSGLRLDLGLAYLNAQYTDFLYRDPNRAATCIPAAPLGDPASCVIDLEGYDLQNAPKYTASGGFNYETNLGVSVLSLGGQIRYTDDKFNTATTDTPRSHIQSMTYIDANIDWSPSDDSKVTFSLWGRNLADKRYIASVFDAPGTLGLVNYAPPREWGATMRYRW